MRFRLVLVGGLAFFVVMNVLLWRSEYAPSSRLGLTVPAEVVWGKVLTSPDDSWLEVRHRGVKLGRAHWRARVSEEVPPVDPDDPFGEAAPEGMGNRVTGYALDFSGNVAIDERTRLRFDLGLELDPAQRWKHFSVKLAVKPYALEVIAVAREEKITVSTTEDDGAKERVYSFADLRNPQKILADLGGPMASAALGAMLGPRPLEGLGLGSPTGAAGGGERAGLVWEARHDRLVFGRTELRVYRLEARLLGRYRAVLIVSPVGEILRLELPDDLVMENDALFNQ